ncbi:MAG: RHS repeat protein, partial [Archangium sp.]|nr:RHS repeat protein [Archangium sp.]
SDDTDICGHNNQTAIVAIQNDVRALLASGTGGSCGDLKDPTATCGGCTPMQGGADAFGHAMCQRCSAPSGGGRTNCVSYATYFGTPHPPYQPQAFVDSSPCVPLGNGQSDCNTVESTSFDSAGPPNTIEDVSLAPQLPCTVGCSVTARAASGPSLGARAETDENLPKPVNAAGQVETSGEENATNQAEAKGDPVALFNGALVITQADLTFPGPRDALVFSRSYSSVSNHRGALGSNWTHSWETRLIPLRKQNLPPWVDPYCAGSPIQTTCVQLVHGDSSRIFYLDQATGIFMPQAGSTASVRQRSGGWAMREPDGSVALFDDAGLLVRVQDRFGVGTSLTYDSTAFGRLYDAVCPTIPFIIQNGQYAAAQGSTGLGAETAQCALLAGLTGFADMPTFAPGATVPAFGIPSSNASLTADFSELLVAQAPGYGTPMPYGQRYKRLRTVRDDLGRELTFTYSTKGLLSSVSGPLGTMVSFTYAAPTASAPGMSAVAFSGVNEQFLVEAQRKDSSTGTTEVEATPERGHLYEYAWARAGEQLPADLAAVRAAYKTYFDAIYNCGFATRDQCGGLNTSGVMFANTDVLADEQVRRIYSGAADNITTVSAKNFASGRTRIEVETRYFRNGFDAHFDKAFAQRWGANADPLLPAVSHPALPMTVAWDTSLPLAVFNYVHAAPTGMGGTISGDATDSFLPAQLVSAYPLETLDTAAALETYRKGLLLPSNSTNGLPPGDRLPLLAVDELPTGGASGRKQCNIAELPQLRSRLPGYEPSLDYYDLTLPSLNIATPGVSWSQQLKRSRVSCETLALSQTYDVRHNDLASTWTKAMGGGYAFETMTGRRKHNAANANRICEWVQYVDRDGDVHFSGLNFHGRPLVEAVQVAGSWKIGETLYNADGNVISQRRTVSDRAFVRGDGETRYTYQEEFIEPHSLGTVRPFHWMRRANVTRVETLSRGAVNDDAENTTAVIQSRGRYAAFAYEPFFNQVRLVETGAITTNGDDARTSSTSMVFDYQEFEDGKNGAGPTELQPLLAEAQLWGAGIRLQTPINPRNPQRVWDATQLQVGLLAADINGDGESSARGVPVRILEEGLNGAKEFTFISWNTSGQPTRIDGADGTRTTFAYYALGAGVAGQRGVTTSATVNSGFAGFLARVTRTRTRWDGTGPATIGAGCTQLPPEYRFLLQSCGANLATQLAGLGLTSEAVSGITGAATGFSTQFDYNAAGHLREVFQYSGESVRITTDTDGREVRSELHAAGGALTSATVTSRDDFMRANRVARFDSTGGALGAVIRGYDNEDKLTTECAQIDLLSCRPGLFATGVRTSVIYTREGDVFRAIDSEGLVTEYARDARKWVTSTRVISPIPTEGTRETTTVFDDDGNVRSRVYGTQAGTRLEESMAYDGLNRLIQHTETTGTVWDFRYSRRELLTSRNHPAPAPWSETFRYDDFGRTSSVTRNGVVAVTFRRVPGGAVFERGGDGRTPTFVSYDALGRAVWTSDSLHNQSVATESRGSATPHVVTQSQLRKRGTGFFTTGTVATLDALGLPVTVRESGGTLSRTTTLSRSPQGFVTAVTAPDTARTEADYDFLGRVTELREQRDFGVSVFDRSLYEYNNRGQLTYLTDPKGEATVQEYTGFGEPKRK